MLIPRAVSIVEPDPRLGGAAAVDLAWPLLVQRPQEITLRSWWAAASPAVRISAVLRLVRRLDDASSIELTALSSPEFVSAGGILLALARYVNCTRVARASKKRNTLLALKNDWRIWRRWCKADGWPSFNPSPRQLRSFLSFYGPRHKVATIRRLGSSLRWHHQAAGLPDPLAVPELAAIWEAGCKAPDRSRAAASDLRRLDVDQAEGMTVDLLEALLATIGTRRPIDLRDAALLSVAYDVLGRSSEIEAINVEDVKSSRDGTGTVIIERRKTGDRPKPLLLTKVTMEILGRYLPLVESARIRRNAHSPELSSAPMPLFIALRGNRGSAPNRVNRLKSVELARILRKRLWDAEAKLKAIDPNIDIWAFSGHSMRVGAAQDLASVEASDVAIAQAGGWKSLDTVLRYVMRQRARQSAVARGPRAMRTA